MHKVQNYMGFEEDHQQERIAAEEHHTVGEVSQWVEEDTAEEEHCIVVVEVH
jgi:hypothetical protein